MISTKPYLIRAIYEWIVDNEFTPYLVINSEVESVQVPKDYIEEGRIVLNISPKACRGLHLENDRIVFSARFNGEAYQIYSPPKAILAIYAKENGRGMLFTDEDEYDGEGGDTPVPPSSNAAATKGLPGVRKPRLIIVK